MDTVGPISNYAPYLWAAFAVGAGSLGLFYGWLVFDYRKLIRQKKALQKN